MTEDDRAKIIDSEDEKIEPKELTRQDWDILEDSIEQVLIAFGWDMDNPSVMGTPKRFLRYLEEFHQAFDVEDILGTPFESPDNSMVIQDGIPFRMICEHHLLPATGKAAIGYLPNGKVLGLSKFVRLVQAIGAERPSLQEHITDKVAKYLNEFLQPKGVYVVMEAEHGCMSCRGVNAPGVITRTSKVTGVFFEDSSARAEFLEIAQLGVVRRG